MYDLERFVTAQERKYESTLQEIRDGCKQGHWMWYMFPQMKGLGNSEKSRYYGIESAEEAHLHFEMTYNGEAVDPLSYIAEESREVSFGSDTAYES